MLLVRPLLYDEKTLDDFDVDNDESLFKLFMDLLLQIDGTRVTDSDAEKKITQMMNDACFISNAVIQMKRPYLKYADLMELASRPTPNSLKNNPDRADIVMCMVYLLLGEHGDNSTDIIRFKSIIESKVKGRCQQSKERFEMFYDSYYESEPTYLSGEFVVKLPITPERLKRVCWSDISNDYDLENLKDIVSFWNDPHERNLILDDIESEIKRNAEDDLPF